jgi:hypothetical protein
MSAIKGFEISSSANKAPLALLLDNVMGLQLLPQAESLTAENPGSRSAKRNFIGGVGLKALLERLGCGQKP